MRPHVVHMLDRCGSDASSPSFACSAAMTRITSMASGLNFATGTEAPRMPCSRRRAVSE